MSEGRNSTWELEVADCAQGSRTVVGLKRERARARARARGRARELESERAGERERERESARDRKKERGESESESESEKEREGARARARARARERETERARRERESARARASARASERQRDFIRNQCPYSSTDSVPRRKLEDSTRRHLCSSLHTLPFCPPYGMYDTSFSFPSPDPLPLSHFRLLIPSLYPAPLHVHPGSLPPLRNWGSDPLVLSPANSQSPFSVPPA